MWLQYSVEAVEKPVNQGTIASRNNGNETQDMDQDVRHLESRVDNFSLNTLANDINKILRCTVSLLDKFEDLGTRLQRIEAELKKYQPKPKPEIPTEEKPPPYNPNICLPTFPDKFNLDVFCNWVKEVEFYFEYYRVPKHEKIDLVANTLPLEGEAFKWWQDIQKLNKKVYKNGPFGWTEMKMLFLDKFLSP
ncbi:unnamed protein product [Lactuca saligna]|uniref:Retrotransposon gag domain-containing protein n=1 Tax=Lactuca saligna TaxID=75948 RepID=A0AA35YHP5_LACSI|nr:unnamed protein product [Lactuca saligna]